MCILLINFMCTVGSDTCCQLNRQNGTSSSPELTRAPSVFFSSSVQASRLLITYRSRSKQSPFKKSNPFVVFPSSPGEASHFCFRQGHPLPLLHISTPPHSGMATKWGIISVGKISFDFVNVLSGLPKEEHVVVAVAARDSSRAKEFAAKHSIPKAYGDYTELAQDPDIDVVYVGNLNPDHFAVSKLLLEHGKNVLCEKPLCMNQKEVKILIDLAKKKNVFFMEAIWSRFFPVYEHLRQEIQSGSIGDVVQVSANFGVAISHVPRVSQKDLGGGTILDLGVYTFQFANLILGPEAPQTIKASGFLNAEGVDLNMSCILTYSGNRTAVLSCSSLANFKNDAYVYGTKGYIKIPDTFWCPTRIIVNDKEMEFPLPKNSVTFNFVNSSGLAYEAAEVRKCLKAETSSEVVVKIAYRVPDLILHHQRGFTGPKLTKAVAEDKSYMSLDVLRKVGVVLLQEEHFY